MGRGKKRQRKNGGEKNGNKFRKQEAYKNIVMENQKFEDYYKGQNLIPIEDWDKFMATLRTPLPTTFRITEGIFAAEIKRKLEKDFLSKEHCDQVTLEDGSIVTPPQPLPWYPGNNAWYFKATKREIRRLSKLAEFHKFLVSQTDNGNISRQEAVSMVPPFFLDVQSHHRVLDMCAAPGSKTAQILEAIHAGAGKKLPTGIVVANELCRERCYMLVHQIKRLASPCILVANHEAQNFPFIKVPATEEELKSSNLEGSTKDGKITFQFDRILADVPCSGDGAMRKIPDMWQKWTPALGLGLHRLQLKIAIRGAKLLKVGGRMVYSTCSLNPVEDEAVVAQLIRECKGSLKLVDVSTQLPELKRFPGTSSWKIQDKFGKWYGSYSEVSDRSMKAKIPETVFPPTEEEIKELELHKCMRFFPHINDTGGFFVAVFEKVRPIAWPNQVGQSTSTSSESKEEIDTKDEVSEQMEIANDVKEEIKVTNDAKEEIEVKSDVKEEMKIDPNEKKEESEITTNEGQSDTNQKDSKRNAPEEPFLPLSKAMMEPLQEMVKLFGIRDDFPYNQLMARSEKSPKIYFLSPTIVELLANDIRKTLQVINTGVKLFVKHSLRDQSTFRLSQEGIQWLYPYVTKRVITITEKEFFILLEKKDPVIYDFTLDTKTALDILDQGAVIFVIGPNCVNEEWAGMVAAGWKGKVSCKLLIPKEEIQSLLDIGRKDFIQKKETN